MKTPALRPLTLGAAAIAVTLMLLGRAQAGDDDFYPPVTDPLTVQECASCHIAFPASMLPAASWTRMMG
ncbi:MAG TPA: cytochrome C, partial [Thauera aminoaromatica]|nr:cytochrome C [Thauera aminoaromatica]HND59278.1 cytochrome C [Thauera aminoaromatica]HNF00434.1 cytochrome C [Thauera aminoaromatica]HNF77459.1 cytochrome C [Thauera aminoaromatica]